MRTPRPRVAAVLIVALAALLAGAAPAVPATRPTTAPTAEVPAAEVPAAGVSAGFGGRAVVVPLVGEIDDYRRDSLQKRFKQAVDLGADTVIVKVNTYGGLVTSGLDISRFLKQQTGVHTVAYVEDKAISAGAMISLACDEIVMQPFSQLGDTGVIAMGAGGIEEVSDHTRAKMESPVLEDFRDSANRNGYSPVLVQAMVNLGRTVHYVQNAETGERRFVDDAEYEKLTARPSAGSPFRAADDAGDGGARAEWFAVEGVPNPLDGPTSLLIVSADLASKIGLSEGEYATVDQFAESRGMNVVATIEPSFGDELMGWGSSAGVKAILTTVFMFSVYMAFSHPGTGAPEAIAAASLAVLLGVPLMTGYAEWYEAVAVLLGVALIAVEVFVLPGFGVAGISGLVLLFGGLALTFVGPLKTPGLPAFYGVDWTRLRNGLGALGIGMAASLVLWWWLSRYVQKSPFARGLVLNTVVGSTIPPGAGESLTPAMGGATGTATAALWPAPGAVGRSVTDLRPGGAAAFPVDEIVGTRVVDVVCDRGFVRSQTEVVVQSIAGSRVVVRPA